MGYHSLSKLGVIQLQRLVHARSGISDNVVLTEHAKAQMKRRGIVMPSIYRCLTEGAIRQAPVPNEAFGTLECRMERRCSGRDLGVVVAMSDDDADVIVVTAMIVGR